MLGQVDNRPVICYNDLAAGMCRDRIPTSVMPIIPAAFFIGGTMAGVKGRPGVPPELGAEFRTGNAERPSVWPTDEEHRRYRR
jgi:hypothetical protein